MPPRAGRWGSARHGSTSGAPGTPRGGGRGAQLAAEIGRLFAAHRGRYGSPRITADLHEAGWRVSKNTVAKIMAEQRLVARRRRARRGGTRPGRGRWRAPDLIGRRSPPRRSTAPGTATGLRSTPTRASCSWTACWTWPHGGWSASPWASITTPNWPMRRGSAPRLAEGGSGSSASSSPTLPIVLGHTSCAVRGSSTGTESEAPPYRPQARPVQQRDLADDREAASGVPAPVSRPRRLQLRGLARRRPTSEGRRLYRGAGPSLGSA